MSTPPTPEFVALQSALVGRFSLERELGRGGMGVVYLARDIALERPVAIKVLPLATSSPDLRERFVREARTAAKLAHPNVVPIHLVEERGELVYFVMSFIDGETLGQRVRRAGPLAASQVARVMQEVAWALAYAHGRGVVHRDIKPDNILIDKDSGRALVTDFGIARVTGSGTMTGAGDVVGTPSFMSPEQALGSAVDGRSDLFSLGVTAYYALSGTLPFDGPNLPVIVTRIVTMDVPPIASVRSGLPATVARAVDKCLAKAPDDRFATGEDLAEAIGPDIGAHEVAPPLRNLFNATHGLNVWLFFIACLVTWSLGQRRFVIGFALGAPLIIAYEFVRTIRRAVISGFGPDDVRRALGRLEQQRAEDRVALGAAPSEDISSTQRAGVKKLGIVLGVVGVTIVGVASFTDASQIDGFLPVAAILATICLLLSVLLYTTDLRGSSDETWGVLPSPFQHTRENGNLLTVGEALLGTRFGDWVFAVARRGLNQRAPATVPDAQATEVRLADSAVDLFLRLPADVRARFSQIPEVVQRLEADAAALRVRAAPPARGVESAAEESVREAFRARLATAIAALENIRLDLMRLESGAGSADDLTADIERARDIGAAVDAELYAREEITELLNPARASRSLFRSRRNDH